MSEANRDRSAVNIGNDMGDADFDIEAACWHCANFKTWHSLFKSVPGYGLINSLSSAALPSTSSVSSAPIGPRESVRQSVYTSAVTSTQPPQHKCVPQHHPTSPCLRHRFPDLESVRPTHPQVPSLQCQFPQQPRVHCMFRLTVLNWTICFLEQSMHLQPMVPLLLVRLA